MQSSVVRYSLFTFTVTLRKSDVHHTTESMPATVQGLLQERCHVDKQAATHDQGCFFRRRLGRRDGGCA
jgi:hypothetical protein